MGLLLFPFRLVLKLVSLALWLAIVAVLAGGGYFAYNYFRPTSQAAIDGLAQGTVTVRAENREGTGSVIKSGDDWEVVTAGHVVAGSKTVEVEDRSGARQQAKVLTLDQDKDVAILAVKPGRNWTALPVRPDLPSPGQKVVTRCFFDDAPRQGLLAGPIDDVRVGDEHIAQLNLADILQPLRTFSPLTGQSVLAFVPSQSGCSGAPLLDQSGRIVGIVLAGGDKSTIAITSRSAFQ